MSENVTFSTIGDEAVEIFDEEDDYSEDISPYLIMYYLEVCYTTVLLVIGVPCNIFALLVLIRRRLWLQHEAYVYLAAILIVNVVKLVLFDSSRWLDLIDHRLLKLSTTADIFCKLYAWALHVISCMNWLHVLMLLNVYLRQQLITSNDRRGCCTNLTAKYCTLFGTKVVISSFFISYGLANFLPFSLSILRKPSFSDWYCSLSMLHIQQFRLLSHVSWWLRVCISLLLVLPLLLLVVWKIKRSSRNTFSDMNGASQGNGVVEVMVRIALLCAAAFFVLNAPLCIVHAFYTYNSEYQKHIHIIIGAVRLIALSYPLSTPIVCFAMKSRFRDDLNAMVKRCCYRCCPGARCHRTLPPERESDGSSVLQMDPIEAYSPVTGIAEESDLIQQI